MTNTRWLSLYVLCIGFLLIVVDMTIVNVALPSIGRDLAFSPSGLAWVINGYLIPFAGFLLLAGRLADLVGSKRVFLAGLAIFTVASFACGLAHDQAVLVAARFVQGVGGAASSAVVLAMIVSMFPEPEEQARAFGIFSSIASGGAAIGLLAGGLITQSVNWHWIFFVNVPIGLATGAIAYRLLASDRGLGLHSGADFGGAALVTSALMLGVYAIVAAAVWIGILAVALLVAFIVRQALITRPILPLRVFRSASLSGANAVQALVSAGFLSFFFLGALDLQHVLGYGPLALGLGFLPVAVLMGLFSVRYSARLVNRFGAYRIVLAGQLLMALALVLLGIGPERAVYARDLLVPMCLLGLGGALAFPALTMIAMAGVAREDTGLASGLLNTSGQVGGALGLAVLATVAAGRTAALGGAGSDPLIALADGFHLAWLVSAGIVIITVGISVATLRPATPDLSAASVAA